MQPCQALCETSFLERRRIPSRLDVVAGILKLVFAVHLLTVVVYQRYPRLRCPRASGGVYEERNAVSGLLNRPVTS